MYYGAAPKLFEFAKLMRYAPTKAEQKIWELLNAEPFLKYKFRRQHTIATFIADFYSHQLKLVIEIDGGVHELKEQKQFDNFRDEEMKALGISVLRIKNEEVLNRTQPTLEKIKAPIANYTTPQSKD